ncbi:Hypothetical predicted protein [Octopus vulgaris]|uniref:Uncharacterized protein n=1 Tax=Octopus vulgaris TaxID=6645 RepID=A0AA36F6C7_OCTVU|nr:Hypothetical predicted protein [Octopus vulgaris]
MPQPKYFLTAERNLTSKLCRCLGIHRLSYLVYLMFHVHGQKDNYLSRMPSGGYIAGKALTRWEADTDNIDIDYRSLEGDNRCKWLNECFSGRKGLVLRILLVFVLFCVGLIVGYIIRRNVHEHFIAPATKCEPQTPQGYWDGIREKILAELDRPRNYEQHLRNKR